MKFIKLTKGYGELTPIYIDMDKVKTFQPSDNGSYLELIGNNEDYIYVKETPEEILKKIKDDESEN